MNKFVTVEISKGLSDAIKDLDMISVTLDFWVSGKADKFTEEINEIKDELGFIWSSQALMYLVATKAYKTKEPKYYLTKTFKVDGERKTFYKYFGEDLVTDKVNAVTYTEKELQQFNGGFLEHYTKEEVK